MKTNVCGVLFLAITSLCAAAGTATAEPLKIGYSDWPGYTLLEVAKQKGWFKEVGVDVDLVWFDYLASIDAYSAGKIDADCIVATDALGAGATGAKGKFIALLDFSEGSDMIVGKPGIESIKDLKGQKVGVEIGLVEHLLLLQALKDNGMTPGRRDPRAHAHQQHPADARLGPGGRRRRVVPGVGSGAQAGRQDRRNFSPARRPKGSSTTCWRSARAACRNTRMIGPRS